MLKVSMIIFSHLSDVQHEIGGTESQQELANRRINFVKTLINRYPNTEERISDESLKSLWAGCCNGACS